MKTGTVLNCWRNCHKKLLLISIKFLLTCITMFKYPDDFNSWKYSLPMFPSNTIFTDMKMVQKKKMKKHSNCCQLFSFSMTCNIIYFSVIEFQRKLSSKIHRAKLTKANKMDFTISCDRCHEVLDLFHNSSDWSCIFNLVPEAPTMSWSYPGTPHYITYSHLMAYVHWPKTTKFTPNLCIFSKVSEFSWNDVNRR